LGSIARPLQIVTLEEYRTELLSIASDAELLDFCRRNNLHGTPVIFGGNESDYYSFRKRIAENFEVYFDDVMISGSAKLGFSPQKGTLFDLDSDIDVAIVSMDLFERIMESIRGYQMQLRENRKTVTQRELDMYHKFLEYGAMGWLRPDLLPTSFRVRRMKDDWFAFFQSISYGKSEVGNYKVSGGVFKSKMHFEEYAMSGLRSLRTRLEMR
jgi:hypothetical protein